MSILRVGRTVLAAGLLVGSIWALQTLLDKHDNRETRQIQDLAQLPHGDYLKPALLGFHHLGSDLFWLQLLQVLGKKQNTSGEHEWIYHALDVITTLDPQYDYAYYVGGVVLTNNGNRVDLSNRLLEKGFAANPTVWNLPFLLGYNHYFVMGDAPEGARYMAEAAKLPGGPAYLPGLATRMYAEAKSPDSALQLLEVILQHTEEPGMRQELETRMKELTIERDLHVLETAVQEYRAQTGHLPSRLDDLVQANMLWRIPQEPFGGSYEWDQHAGKVSSSTHPERLRVYRPEDNAKFRQRAGRHP